MSKKSAIVFNGWCFFVGRYRTVRVECVRADECRLVFALTSFESCIEIPDYIRRSQIRMKPEAVLNAVEKLVLFFVQLVLLVPC